jgi:hypothetical protein
MKKLIYLLPVLLSSCSTGLSGGKLFLPAAFLGIGLYSVGKWGYFKFIAKEKTDNRIPLWIGIGCIVVSIAFFIGFSLDK